MEQNFPESLHVFFTSQPENYEYRTNPSRKIVGIVLLLACVVLIVFPGIVMEGWIVRGLAIFGAIVSAAYAFLGVGDFINRKSGGKIKDLGWVKFAKPERGTVPFGPEDMPIITMYKKNDWAGLAYEPTAEDRPMQLHIMLDEKGKEIYLQLCRYGVASVLQGIDEVKIIREPEYSQVVGLIKGMKA